MRETEHTREGSAVSGYCPEPDVMNRHPHKGTSYSGGFITFPHSLVPIPPPTGDLLSGEVNRNAREIK